MFKSFKDKFFNSQPESHDPYQDQTTAQMLESIPQLSIDQRAGLQNAATHLNMQTDWPLTQDFGIQLNDLYEDKFFDAQVAADDDPNNVDSEVADNFHSTVDTKPFVKDFLEKRTLDPVMKSGDNPSSTYYLNDQTAEKAFNSNGISDDPVVKAYIQHSFNDAIEQQGGLKGIDSRESFHDFMLQYTDNIEQIADQYQNRAQGALNRQAPPKELTDFKADQPVAVSTQLQLDQANDSLDGYAYPKMRNEIVGAQMLKDDYFALQTVKPAFKIDNIRDQHGNTDVTMIFKNPADFKQWNDANNQGETDFVVFREPDQLDLKQFQRSDVEDHTAKLDLKNGLADLDDDDLQL